MLIEMITRLVRYKVDSMNYDPGLNNSKIRVYHKNQRIIDI